MATSPAARSPASTSSTCAPSSSGAAGTSSRPRPSCRPRSSTAHAGDTSRRTDVWWESTLWLAKVYVTLKPVVNDPQGLAIKGGLQHLGFETVDAVRMGKYLEITV